MNEPMRSRRRSLAWSLLLVVAVVAAVLAWPQRSASGQPTRDALPQVSTADAERAPAAAAARDPVAAPGMDARQAADAELLIRVVNGAGSSVVGCTVLAWSQAEATLSEGATDAAGQVRLPGQAASGGVLAATPTGAWGLLHPIVLQGEHTILFDDAASLTGMVLIDGQPGGHCMRVDVHSRPPALPEGTPSTVEARVAQLLQTCQLDPAPDGTFAMRGLATDWRGTVVAPPGCWFMPTDGVPFQPRWLPLTAPAHVVIQLVRLPSVRGHVRWSDGEPAGGAFVGVDGELVSGMRVVGETETAADGRFVVALGPLEQQAVPAWATARSHPQLATGTLTCSTTAGSTGPVQLSLTSSALSEPVEVVLTRAARIHFEAVGDDGAPLANARIDRPAPPTDAEGRSWFAGTPPKLIGAPGRAVVPATPTVGDGSEAAPLRFVLPPQNRLSIQVVSADQPAGEGLEVCVESATPLMAGQTDWRELHGEFGGSIASSGSRLATSGSPEMQLLRAVTDSGGRVDLHSLEPRTEVRIAVFDRAGNELGQATSRTPAFGQQSNVVVQLQHAPMRIRGRVESPSGSPIADAEVALIGSRGLAAMLRTDAAGRFEFWCSKTTRLDLRLRADGCVKLLQTDVTRGDGDLGTMRLVPGRSITVRVVDETGAPIDLFAKPAGHEEVHQQRLGVGVWRWPEMPADVEFYAEVGGRRFSALAGPGDDEVVVRATRVAHLWSSPSALPAELAKLPCCVVLHAEPPSMPPVVLELSTDSAGAISVLPGTYRAQLMRREFHRDRTHELVPLSQSKRIELRAGEVTEIRF